MTALDATGVVVVAPMRRRHLRGVLRIEGQQGSGGWSLGLFLSELGRTEGRVYLVARRDRAVLGYAGALLAGDDAHVTTVATDVEHRRARVATRLLVELARRVVARGAKNLTLEVRASNVGAVALYRHFGFAPVGTRVGYYQDADGGREDALVLWATEVDRPAYAERLTAIEADLPSPTVVEDVPW